MSSVPLRLGKILGTHDIVFVTLDTLRYDVARDTLAAGRTPYLKRLLPGGIWEERHVPGSFTYASHQAFFAGFLPTPVSPGPHRRLMALQFPGSQSISKDTLLFKTSNIVEGFAEANYTTICIGGVGYFSKRNPLSRILPSYFQHSYWNPGFSVSQPSSTTAQISLAVQLLDDTKASHRLFLFINISALHHPTHHYVPGADTDSVETQAAALQYVDGELPRLFEAIGRRGPSFCILCSDHGTAFGEDGYHGHRIGHPSVWTVPYAEFLFPS